MGRTGRTVELVSPFCRLGRRKRHTVKNAAFLITQSSVLYGKFTGDFRDQEDSNQVSRQPKLFRLFLAIDVDSARQQHIEHLLVAI